MFFVRTKLPSFTLDQREHHPLLIEMRYPPKAGKSY